MGPKEFSDDELLQAMELDVNGTFPLLMEAYHSQLYNFVVGQVKNQQTAEDIMQDCWMRIFQALDRYSAKQIRTLKLRPWLFTIVRNQTLTVLKKKSTQGTFSIDDLNNLNSYLEDNWELRPEEVFEIKSRVGEVRAAIGQLPSTYHTILTLYLFQELSYQEIASKLRQPVGNVRTYVSRGLKLLREKLAANVN